MSNRHGVKQRDPYLYDYDYNNDLFECCRSVLHGPVSNEDQFFAAVIALQGHGGDQSPMAGEVASAEHLIEITPDLKYRRYFNMHILLAF